MNQLKQIFGHSMSILVLCTLMILLAHPALPVHAAAELFVSEDGSGTDCTRINPCDLTTGLNTSATGDVVIVKAGLYTTGNGTGHEVVFLDKTISLLGGWDGDETGIIVRDGLSTLDGKDAQRVITITGGSTIHPVVDGWTITGGNATGIVSFACKNWYSGDILGCGGGIYINGAEPTISNNLIYGNVAADATAGSEGAGGGLYILNSGGTVITNNDIHDNDACINGEGDGGGIFINDSGGKTSVFHNQIHENEGSSTSYYASSGMGIFLAGNTDQIQIFDNDIYGNNPNKWSASGVAVYCQYCDETVLIDENEIHDNFGSSAIVLSYSNPTIQQNIIINPEMTSGINVYATDTDPHDPGVYALIVNNIIADHISYNIYVYGLIHEESHLVLIHNTLVNSDYGLYVNLVELGAISFDRGIVSGAALAGIYQYAGSATDPAVSYTLFYNNAIDGDVGASPIYGDPHFVDPAGANYHLRVNSAAVNAVSDGGVYEDIDDDDRPSGWGVTPYDVGADEFVFSDFLFMPIIIRP
jgi:hypothetical protein